MILWKMVAGTVGIALGALALGALAAGAASTTRPAAGAAKAFAAVPDPRLHNVHRVTAKVTSGARPEGEAGFAALRELGVRTVISVDGARPDVETAKRHGLRYVHLPIGYDGVGAERGEELARAIDELPGPLYVHCHHGKHRSAAAVAVACVLNGSLRPEQAQDVLRTFGTGEDYVGLWRDARSARPMERGTLEGRKVRYVEVAEIGDLAGAMAAVDRHWTHLKRLEKARWRKLEADPDLSAGHEALQLVEHLAEIGRGEDAGKRDGRYRSLLEEAVDGGRALGGALTGDGVDAATADRAMKRVGATCVACHRGYRD